MMREGFGSRTGAILALAGSAVGLGNLWRFPYLVGENGGAAFILLYIIFTLFICIPLFTAEFIVGRRSQSNTFVAYSKISGNSGWKWAGAFTVLIPTIVISYYSVIGGWSVAYFFKACSFGFTNVDQTVLNGLFSDLVSSTWTPIIGHTIFMAATALIVAMGIKKGIEIFSKIMMPLLFIMVLAIAAYSLFLPGASEGVEYLLRPDFSKINAESCIAALGQSFFSLSLGFGIIMTYASYVSKQESVIFQSLATSVSDSSFAIIAGLAIMPAVFAFGLEPGAGPGLVFQTLPYIFSQMPMGGIIAIIFFAALLIAALTSSISLCEVVVAVISEEMKMSRKKAVAIVFAIVWSLGILCSLSFGPLSDVKILGLTFFDLFDKISANILMPLGGLLVTIFVGWKMKKSDVYDEFTNSGTLDASKKIFGVCYFIVRYLAPLAIITIFITSLI